MQEKVTYHPIKEELYPQLIKLYKQVFNFTATTEFIKSLFKNVIGYMALDNEKPIAYYGAIKTTMNINDTDILAAQSSAAMTLKEYQKQGLFTKLSELVNTEAQELGVQFVFTFPNENSIRGFRKFGYKFYDYMYSFSFKSSAFPFCEISHKFKLKKLYNRYVLRRLAEYTIELDLVHFEDYNGVKKDKNFLRFKILNNCYLIAFRGFKMLVKAEGHLLIGDVEKFEVKRVYEFIKAVKKLQLILMCKESVFIANNNHWLYNYLSWIMIPHHSLPIAFYEISKDIDYSKIQFTLADFDSF